MSTEREASRYSAHLALERIGAAGQRAIGAAHVLLVGIGGLGCAAAQYLVASGVGRLTLCDFDTVALSNLARQVLYREEDVGRRKTTVARAALEALNADVRLSTIHRRMTGEDLAAALDSVDLVIDASDNYGTRLSVNRTCLAAATPWVMGSCVRMEGQLILFTGRAGEPCYRCAYGSAPDTLEDCPGAGIFAPVAGVVGSAMAHLALARLAGGMESGRLHVLDATRWAWRSIRVQKNPDCPDCGSGRDT